MTQKRNAYTATDIEKLQRDIETWRKNNRKGTPIPQRLWNQAVALARIHGAYVVARELHLNSKRLKDRALGEKEMEQGVPEHTFVQVDTENIFGAKADHEVVVELCREDGSTMTVHLPSPDALDMPSMVEAFFRCST